LEKWTLEGMNGSAEVLCRVGGELPMKAVILAGGMGSRLSEETSVRPKPMVEIGGRPILWHIMKIYSAYGIHDFIICLGYKGNMIKEYFANYFLYSADVTIDLAANKIENHRNNCEPWRVTLVDTGANTMTGGRLQRVMPYVEKEEMFCLTYGDGVSDVNIGEEIAFHKQQNKLVTTTAVQPTGRFGALQMEEDGSVSSFTEKPKGDARWVNGGFFILSPKIGKYLKDDTTIWEREPLETLAREGQVAAYKHAGFWQPMDTMHDRNLLEEMWASGSAPWKVW
jgi:glucose-1-phosphate cytidylyltransferase